MPNETTLIATIAIALVGALLMGLLAARLRLPPIVGYLVAGIAMHALAPDTVPIGSVASEASEIGVVLLMFGVGLHFSVRDLLDVRKTVVPGALLQIAV